MFKPKVQAPEVIKPTAEQKLVLRTIQNKQLLILTKIAELKDELAGNQPLFSGAVESLAAELKVNKAAYNFNVDSLDFEPKQS